MMVMSLFHVGAACLCQHQLSHANYMGFVCRVYFCSTFVYTTGAMVNTFPWQAKGCWFDSSWRDRSPLRLHQKGDLKLCQIKHAELSAVASPSGKRVTASFFLLLITLQLLYIYISVHFWSKSHTLPGNFWVAVTAGHVERRPAVLVSLMDIGAIFDQQLHHLQVPR